MNSQLTLTNENENDLHDLDYPQMLHQTQESNIQQEMINFENALDSESFIVEP